MSENIALQKVIQHLKELAEFSQKIAGSLQERREVMDRYFAVTPECLENELEIQEAEVDGHVGYWVVPKGHKGNRRLLYIHGGSWMSGSIRTYRAFIEKLAIATNCAVLFLEYPLTPEHPYPAGLNASVAAFQWLRENGLSENRGQNDQRAEKIYIAGDSAGGNLALCTLVACKQQGIPQPDAAIAISPSVDLTFSSNSFKTNAQIDPIISPEVLPLVAEFYLQKAGIEKSPTVSPLFADLTGLSPLMLQTGEAEVLIDDSIRFAEAAKGAGVDVTLDLWPDMPHVFQGFAPFLPEAQQAIDKMGEFLKSQ